MASATNTISTLRQLLSELRRTMASEKKIRNTLAVRHVLNQYRKHQVTDETLCKAREEMNYLSETYLCYLRSTRKYSEIKSHYHGKGERSTEETANMVGFKLPHEPK